MSGDNLGYGSGARLISLPEPRRTGSWWRRIWTLDSRDISWPDSLTILEPPDELGEISGVVAVIKMSPTQARMEVMTRSETVPWNVLAYCSVVAIHLNRQLGGEMLIDGSARHPLLRLVKLP